MDEMNNQSSAKKNGLAIAGMVVGIVSIIPALNFYCITGVVGLVLSILGLKKVKEVGSGKAFAIAGLVCSIVGIVIGIFAIIALATLASAVNSYSNELTNAMKSLNSLYK